MKLTRPDLTSLILCALCVVGIVGLSLFRIPVPDAITYIAVGALGIGGGTALNSNGTVDTAAQRITEALSSVEALIADMRAGKLAAAASDAAAAASEVAAVIPAPAIPGPAVPINGYPVGVTR